MAAFAVKATLQRVESYLKASGYFQDAQVGEPKGPPCDGTDLAARCWMKSAAVVENTLTGTIEVHSVLVRVYRNMLAEPVEDIEYQMAEAVSKVVNTLLGEYDLGASIRNVSVGQYGAAVGTEWGYAEVGGKWYRVADITLPLIVDDSATFAA